MTSRRSPRSPPRYIALTGVPGTGKTSSARELPARIPHIEVAELAQRWLDAGTVAGSVVVDLPQLGRWISSHPPTARTTLVVGHLSHLLPIRDVILLRCHPRELSRRLRRRRELPADDRRDNLWAEATDVILFEARRRGRRIWEVDTTGRTAPQVARRIVRLVDHPPAPSRQFADWLGEPSVTEHLLDP